MVDKIPGWMVKEWMGESLSQKIDRSNIIIKRFYDAVGGEVHISDSGGKDSLVQRHLVRSLYPDTPAVHVAVPRDPDTVKYVKTIDNLETLVPKHSYAEVVKRWGYPVVSKEVSKNISRYCSSRNRGDEGMMRYRLTGNHPDGRTGLSMGVIPKKWQFLVDAPFKISDVCCDVMKKKPLVTYEKKHGTKPFMGILAEESDRRMRKYREFGCTILTEGKEKCMPLSHWTEKDVWDYIKLNDLEYSSIYDKGESRTGCIGCMFGCHLEGKPNRFQRLYHRWPKLYDYYMNRVGLGKVLDYVGIDYTPIGRIDDYLQPTTP